MRGARRPGERLGAGAVRPQQDRLELVLELLPDRDAGLDGPGGVLARRSCRSRSSSGERVAAAAVARGAAARVEPAAIDERELLRRRPRRPRRSPSTPRSSGSCATFATSAWRIRTRCSDPVSRSRAGPSPFVHPCEGGLFQFAEPALLRVDHVRRARPRQQAAPLGAPVARVGQALVPALRLQRVKARVPVADVAVRVGRDHVLVPGHVAQRRVDLVARRRRR